MLTDYKTIELDNLDVGDTILISMRKVDNEKIEIQIGERILTSNKAIAALNQSDRRYAPRIRRAWFPAEPYDILVGMGIDIEKLDWKLNDNLDDVVHLNYLNPKYKGARLRVQVTETTDATTLEHALYPEKYAKRKGKHGDFIKHNGDYIFSNVDAIISDKEPQHTFLKSDFWQWAETYSIKNQDTLEKLKGAPKHLSWAQLQKYLTE